MKIARHSWQLQLLLAWLAIGTGLRFTHLAAKPPWTDEIATMVFSLGHSFQLIPLNRAISIDILLKPLQPDPTAGIGSVVHHLLSEDTHPPIFFGLAHFWMQLWPADADGLTSVWAIRALSALFGALSIPAIFGLGWLAFRSQLVGQIAAAMMAVSPYGVFMAQEARHYTLGILWVIASLGCLVIAVRHMQQRTPLPVWLGLSWVSINLLGISTHYLFALALCAEAIVLGRFWILDFGFWINLKSIQNPKFWQRIYVVAIGTLAGSLFWLLVFWHSSERGQLTQWIKSERVGLAWLNPVFQALATWLTTICLLPVEADVLLVAIASGVVMLVFFLWVIPILSHGLKVQMQQPDTRLMTQVFGGVVGATIAMFFGFAYGLGIDLTRGARYSFVYFPAAIVLIAASLAICWQGVGSGKWGVGNSVSPLGIRGRRGNGKWRVGMKIGVLKTTGRWAVVSIWLMALASGLTVVENLGYRKYYRPDLLVPLMQQVSQAPILIATTHRTLEQTGEMMGLALEIERSGSAIEPQFLLAHQAPNSSTPDILQQTLNQLPRPLDLWLVNFHAPVGNDGCVPDPRSLPAVNGYDYRLYHCYLTE